MFLQNELEEEKYALFWIQRLTELTLFVYFIFILKKPQVDIFVISVNFVRASEPRFAWLYEDAIICPSIFLWSR